ncbi:MAG: hypothetical protein GY754_29365 [bacterium]|nr:hypothetical protein [bacterium]
MGITIFYKGNLNDPDLIESICLDLENIAKELEWEYLRSEKDYSNNTIHLKGIILRPHKDCDSFCFSFTEKGKLLFAPMLEVDPENKNIEKYDTFVKTQFAPVEIHMAIIKILKFIKSKYMADLDVRDDGGYWESGDEEELKGNLGQVGLMMDIATSAISEMNDDDSRSHEELVGKIERVVSEKMKEHYDKAH